MNKRDANVELVSQESQNEERAGPLAAKALTCIPAGDDAAPSRWEHTGDMAALALDTLITAASGRDLVAKAAFERKAAAQQQEIEGLAPTPLERLLAERIVLCWLHLHYVETLFAQNMKTANLTTKEYYQRRIDRAHARYLSSIRTLAQVRRLQRPTLQVNIAEQQVNIAQ